MPFTLAGFAASRVPGILNMLGSGPPTDEDLLGRIRVTQLRLNTMHPAALRREVGKSGDTIRDRLLNRQTAHINMLAGRPHLFDKVSKPVQRQLVDHILGAGRGTNLGEGIDRLHNPAGNRGIIKKAKELSAKLGPAPRKARIIGFGGRGGRE